MKIILQEPASRRRRLEAFCCWRRYRCDAGAANRWAVLDSIRLTNNAAQRALLGIALGRKSWLCAGFDLGGQRAAFIYSLIVTSMMNDVDRQALARRPPRPHRQPTRQAHRRPAAVELERPKC